MKVNSLAKKTAIAAAIAFASGSVFAGELHVATPSVFANEIFGNLSEQTTVRMPAVEFRSNATAPQSVSGVSSAAGDTVKLTLEGQAVFGENYQDPNIWAQQGISVVVGGTTLTPAMVADVTGGTGNDNQITITLAAAGAGNSLDTVALEGFKVKNLKATLERNAAERVRDHAVTVEVRATTGEFENTPAVAAFYSIDGVQVSSTPTTYLDNGGRAWLQAGDDYKTFTAPAGDDADKNDFSTRNTVLDLGEFNFSRGVLTRNAVDFEAGKETGTVFDFTGADTINFTLTSDVALSSYPSVRLTTASNCAASTIGTNGNSIVFNADSTTQTVEWESHNFSLDANSNMRLCVIAPVNQDGNGTASPMPEAKFDLAATVGYFNTRYTDSEGTAPFNRVLRNAAGCQVSLFNVPNPNAQDNAFIRFTNTSSGGEGMTGPVYATVWSQDGQVLDDKVIVVDSLAPHATAVLHTDGSQETGVNLAAKLAGFADSEGRSRIILEGEFTNCEALGLIRTPAGVLTNMTSTVYSGSQNGTSNTRN